MLKSFLLLFLISFSVLAQKPSMDQRRKQILAIVDEELAEVSRLASQQNFSNPDIILRVSELNMEKARLWRETENEQYLSIPSETRRTVRKADYFKRSNDYFEEANEAALTVTKRFPKYKGLGEVHYILAYNYKELGRHEMSKKHFKLSASKTSKGTNVSAKSKMALADYNYNAQKFAAAVPLYEEALKKIDERWWTKDAFNLAWCYYRTQRYEKAITLMRDIHKKSYNSKYINMKSMVERDIAIFYVDAGRMEDAIKFYNSIGLNYTEQFVKIATSITSAGRFAQAETLLDKAAKYEKDPERKVQILFAQIELFDKYNKVDEHLLASEELLKAHKQKPLNQDDLKRLNYQISKKAAELQKAMASGIYKDVKKSKDKKSSQAITYFEMSAQLNPSKLAEASFYQAETAYAVNDFSKAITLYFKAFDNAKAAGDKKIMNQSVEGMISSLGQSELSSKEAEKYYIPVYTRYLAYDQKSERASSIYVKLFNTYYGVGDIPNAEMTLDSFAQSFPKDFKTQEGMLAKIMEHYRKKKDYTRVKFYVAAINDGRYKVSKKYADALRSLMTKIQIEGVQQSLERGDKDVALKGYHQIYENAESTPRAKTNAAYNLSALYYELGDAKQSYLWGVTALKEMDVVDVVKFSDSYLSISSGLFLKQHFSQSADLSHRILVKLCKENSSNKVVAYKNAVFIALANNDLDKAIEIRELGKSCSIADNVIAEVTFEVLKDLAKAKRWEPYENLIVEMEKNPKYYPLLIKPYEDLRKVFQNLGEIEKSNEISGKQLRYYKQAKDQKLEIPVEALDLMAGKLIAVVTEKKSRLDQIRLSFPEGEFNNAVKSKLKILDEMAGQVNEIQKTGSGKGIVDAYRLVISAYEGFGSDLKGFSPEGKSPEYIASFQKAMSDVYNPILANARKQRSEIKKLIVENKILSVSNFSVIFTEPESFKRYLTVKESVLMDRGGKR